ncbi:MAG: chemotaxis protein CheA, partial [Steroidobacteraceae bacterium]|nr:chemotaxis protein CheA [Steroidobacteraceae bacterium]
MTLDPEMQEILQVFFAESSDCLDAMESGLLTLDAHADRETINTIFRAAHSIKGGAGTFGFMEISRFTHGAETLLDEMRNGVRPVAAEAVQLLLEAVDVLRQMLASAAADQPIATTAAQALSVRLEKTLAERDEPVGSAGTVPPPSPPATDMPADVPAELRAGGGESRPESAPAARPVADSGSIRVSTDKVDALINLVGELVITQSMLSRFIDHCEPQDLETLRRGLIHLSRNTRELQESVLKIRMLPIGFSFNRFPRLVHELSRTLGKKVELKVSGEQTELDKTVLEKIADPLVHLVRNSLDHGLETPAQRAAAGKGEVGTLELNAYHEGGNIMIEVKDDGAGINKARVLEKARARGLIGQDTTPSDDQIHNLIFLPGFSTAEAVSDVSGRGVGMDVVRRNINDIGGHVQISSQEGLGTKIRIRLPLTLAILEGQMLRVGRETYVVSLISIVETVQPTRDQINTITGKFELLRHRGEHLPIIRLHEMFDIAPDSRDPTKGLLVVVETDGQRAALLVDELLAQQQVVIKSL